MLRFAFRNVLRNKNRSFLSALAIFVSAIIVLFAQGYFDGVFNMMVNNYVNYQTGDLKIASEEYFKREKFLPVDELIDDSSALIEKINGIEGVNEIEERIKFGILLGRDEKSVSSMGIGIDLENSRYDLKKNIEFGEINKTGMYIGEKLAQKLDVDVGDDMLLVSRTSEGGLNGIKAEISGIFKMGLDMYDSNVFFIEIERAKQLLKIGDGSTEIYVFIKDKAKHSDVKGRIAMILPDNTRVKDFKESIGLIYDMIIIEKYFFYLFEALIVFLASFVIINTLMQAIFERIREIGTLKAMGMKDREIFINFTLEGMILGILGGIPGAFAGYGLVLLTAKIGIDFEKIMEGVEIPMDYIIRPAVNPIMILFTILLTVAVSSMSAMIPAKYAKKLQPSDALKKY